MNKHVIGVPAGIRYLSEWKEFRLFDFPYIIDKQITGCGFTEWAIRCKLNVIVCFPRKALIENKAEQHRKSLEINSELDYRAIYIKNTSDTVISFDKNLNNKLPSNKDIDEYNKMIEKKKEIAVEYKNSIKKFWETCQENQAMDQRQKYCKILVTYDSFRKVKEALIEEGVFDQFYVVVDEFQSILTDARFKADTELEFVDLLSNGSNKVCFVSATPMMDEYMDQLPEFKDLPYLRLDWGMKDPSRIAHPTINSHPCSMLVPKAVDIINKYRNNQFAAKDNNVILTKNDDGTINSIESKEAVFYFNSVKNICDIIKKAKLTQDEANIICASTSRNEKEVRKAFGLSVKNWQGLGRVPLRGEPRKMFTLCTRTVYLGADFYSDNARSFIFSDANIGCLAVDITLDLPQILGRQRLDSNPWKTVVDIYYNPINGSNKLDKETFQKIVNEKIQDTDDLLSVWGKGNTREQFKLSRVYKNNTITTNYYSNYISVNEHEGKEPVPKFNQLVYLMDVRYYEISQLDYADRCTVYSKLSKVSPDVKQDDCLIEFADEFRKLTTFQEKARYLCEFMEDKPNKNDYLELVPTYLANYYRVLGPTRMRATYYRKDRLDSEYERLVNNISIDIDTAIYSNFSVGDKVPSSEIKSKLSTLYGSLGYSRNAKASDLGEWFETKSIKVKLPDNTWVHGFELIKKLK